MLWLGPGRTDARGYPRRCQQCQCPTTQDLEMFASGFQTGWFYAGPVTRVPIVYCSFIHSSVLCLLTQLNSRPEAVRLLTPNVFFVCRFEAFGFSCMLLAGPCQPSILGRIFDLAVYPKRQAPACRSRCSPVLKLYYQRRKIQPASGNNHSFQY